VFAVNVPLDVKVCIVYDPEVVIVPPVAACVETDCVPPVASVVYPVVVEWVCVLVPPVFPYVSLACTNVLSNADTLVYPSGVEVSNIDMRP
jgi:hypothetical protein